MIEPTKDTSFRFVAYRLVIRAYLPIHTARSFAYRLEHQEPTSGRYRCNLGWNIRNQPLIEVGMQKHDAHLLAYVELVPLTSRMLGASGP
jgi:hypothetical protein